MSNYANYNWDDLMYSIEQNEAIVFLGPEILTTHDQKGIYDALFEQLAETRKEAILDFYPKEGLFLFKQEMHKGSYVRQIKQHFSAQQTPEMLSKLIEIPFHLYVNVAPDMLLKLLFEKHKLPHQFLFFSPTLPNTELEEVPKNNPLVYNIMGSFLQDESIVLSHDDLFLYLKAILGESGLPNFFKKQMKVSKDLIFIGFQFNKWYMQLLLRILELDKGKFAFNRVAAAQDSITEIKELCLNQFQIRIIDTNVNSFIDELHLRCQKNSQIALRTLDNAQKIEKVQNDVKLEQQELIKERLKRLLRLLSEYELEHDLEKDPTQRMSYEMKIENLKGKIEDAKTELNNL